MKHPIWSAVLSVITFMGCSAPAVAGTGGGPGHVPQLTVRGEALVHVPADQLRLKVGVVTDDKTAESALERNTASLRDVVEALGKVGLTGDDYQTGLFSIQPKWSSRPRQAPQDWRPGIVGYTVTNSLDIKTKKFRLAGKIIEAVSEAGANSIDTMIFDLSDPRTSRAEAIRKASAHAMADAETLAAAASVRLVRVLSLSLDHAVATPVRIRTEAMTEGAALARQSAVPPIASGEVTVQASVLLIYEIAEKK